MDDGTSSTATVSVTREVAAPAERVWAMVADITRMGEWSPENERATWTRGRGPEVGARFRGVNRNGTRRWSTTGTVSAADPGRLFAFRITAGGLRIAEWRYEFEPIAGGCRVTEVWIDRRGRIAKALGKPVSGIGERAEHNRAGMEVTLDRLKAAAEAPDEQA